MSSRTNALAASLATCAALATSACSSSTSATDDSIPGSSPTIDTFELVSTPGTATLVASVNDADGDLMSVAIDWGDGAREQVTAGFPGVRVTHDFAVAGDYVVSMTATDADGNAVSSVATAALDGDPALATTTLPTTTTPPTTAPPTTTTPPTTTPPTTTPPPPTTTPPPPTTTPPTTTPPPPTTTIPPPPPPEPVTLDLLNAVEWTLTGSEADGAGGSGEAKRVGNSGAGIRSYAWHGYNGSGSGRATAALSFDGTPYLQDAGVDVARVEVQFGAGGNGVLKAPFDRSARIWVDFRSYGPNPQGDTVHTFIDEAIALETRVNSDLTYNFNSGGTHTFLVTSEDAQLSASFDALCTSAGGPQAFALLNEGYCDFFEKGSIQLNSLNLVVTPLPDYHLVDGQPVPIDG